MITAHDVASNPRFDDDRAAYFVDLMDELGWEAASKLWWVACKLYDEEHAEDS